MITFLIPSINRPTLCRALQSLTAQSDCDWRAIVIYDGFYCNPNYQDPRVSWTWIYPKLGTGNAAAGVRGKGLPMARTEWVGFLDDDDTVDYRYTAWLKEAAIKHPDVDVFIFRMQEHSPVGAIIPAQEITKPEELALGKVGISFAIKADVLRGVEWGSNWCEDWDLISNLLSSGKRIVILPHTAYHVRW